MLECLHYYHPEIENISFYMDCIEQFFIENDITHSTQTESKCKAILLSAIGKKTYEILEDLYASQKLSELFHEEIFCYSISDQNILWWQKVTIFIMVNKKRMILFLISLLIQRICYVLIWNISKKSFYNCRTSTSIFLKQ